VAEVRHVIETGEVIEAYPNDAPYPSRLVLGRSGIRSIHVVAADDARNAETIVITVYEPDPNLWNRGLRRRRKS